MVGQLHFLHCHLSFIFKKSLTRAHLAIIVEWQPQTIIMSHGLIVDQDADVFLKRSFSWLR